MSYGQWSENGPAFRQNPVARTEAKQSKRQRNVFSSSEIPHLWAHQTQSSARNAQGNFYFDGPTICSYGSHFPIATIAKNRKGETAFLLTTRSFSVTTGSQISAVRRAIPKGTQVFHISLESYRVPDESAVAHSYNLDDYRADIKELLEKARTAKGLKWEHYLRAHARRAEMLAYASFFGLPALSEKARIPSRKLPSISVSRETAQAHADAYDEKLTTRRAELEMKRRAAQERKALANVEAWRTGDNVNVWGLPDGHPTMLRVKGDEVETSMGATFPIDHAHRGLALVRSVMTRGEDWHTNGHTCHLGHYKIERIMTDGTVYAGCHVVTWAEIDRIAADLEREGN